MKGLSKKSQTLNTKFLAIIYLLFGLISSVYLPPKIKRNTFLTSSKTPAQITSINEISTKNISTIITFSKSVPYAIVVIEFYDPKCDHCVKFRPIYERTALDVVKNDMPLLLFAVDITGDQDVVEEFGIKFTPDVRVQLFIFFTFCIAFFFPFYLLFYTYKIIIDFKFCLLFFLRETINCFKAYKNGVEISKLPYGYTEDEVLWELWFYQLPYLTISEKEKQNLRNVQLAVKSKKSDRNKFSKLIKNSKIVNDTLKNKFDTFMLKIKSGAF
jgi:thiol-disulfide isomerase/thioredoxin